MARSDVELIGKGKRVRVLSYLNDRYGKGRWRKQKGTALVRLANGIIRKAEIHWYEAHGVGRFEFKWKRYVE